MGFVSVCLRKWHARVRWCVRVLVCVCVRGRGHMGVEKMYIRAGDYIFKRVTLYVCAFKRFHTPDTLFSLCSCSAK